MSEASRTLFKPSPRDKAENTTNIARSIMDAEVAAREKKTARLKELRLKHEAELAAMEPKTPTPAPAKTARRAAPAKASAKPAPAKPARAAPAKAAKKTASKK